MFLSVYNYLILSFSLFSVSLYGFILNRKNILLILICIELLLLSINLNFVIFSVYLDDLLGQLFIIFILTIAAAESVIGLSILLLYYRLRGNITLENMNMLKG